MEAETKLSDEARSRLCKVRVLEDDKEPDIPPTGSMPECWRSWPRCNAIAFGYRLTADGKYVEPDARPDAEM